MHDTLPLLVDQKGTAVVDLIVPIWSSARSARRPEFGNMTTEEENGLLERVGNGCWLAGWHGHLGDAFRDWPTYRFLIGGPCVGLHWAARFSGAQHSTADAGFDRNPRTVLLPPPRSEI